MAKDDVKVEDNHTKVEEKQVVVAPKVKEEILPTSLKYHYLPANGVLVVAGGIAVPPQGLHFEEKNDMLERFIGALVVHG